MIWLLFLFSSICLHVRGDEDFSKMRMKVIKQRLDELGGHCHGCTSKRDYIKALKDIIAHPELAQKKPKKKKKASPPPPADAVVVGTGANFESEVLKSKIPVMVEFFAPWCGHCKALAPHWKEAASRLYGKVKLVAVDATIESELGQKYKVQGYPTIKVFIPGATEPTDYQGGREEEGIVAEGLKLVGQKMVTVEVSDISFDADDVQKKLKDISKALVLFYDHDCGKKCDRIIKNFIKVVKTQRKKDPNPRHALLHVVDCTGVKHCKQFGVEEYPTIIYFENGAKVSLFERKPSTIKLLGFAKRPSVQNSKLKPPEKWGIAGEESVPLLKPHTYEHFLKVHDNVLVFFYAPWCGHCKTAKPDIIKAATVIQSKADKAPGMIVGVDCEAYKGICGKFKVKSFPTIVHFKNGKRNKDYGGARTVEGYLAFLEDPDKVVFDSPQEPFLDSGEEHKVSLLTDSSMSKFISENPQVLVMFYAPWCGHCKTAKPGYNEAAKELEGSGKIMAAVDCTVHKTSCETYKIEGFPTIKYFENGKAEDYSGGRDKDAFLSFMKSKTVTKKAEGDAQKGDAQKRPKKKSKETPSRETPPEDHDEL